MPSDPAITVHELAAELGRAADALLARDHDVSFARYRVMRALRRDGAATQHELAGRLGIGDAVVSRTLPGLIDRGWCRVDADPHHGRRRQVALTEAGAELEEHCAETLRRAFDGAADDAGIDTAAFLHAAETLTAQLRRSTRRHPDP